MLNKYPDFWKILLGNGSLGAFLAFTTWALICATISVLVNVVNRDVANTATPVKFSWRFMLADNIPRIIANLLSIPVAIRLSYEYLDSKWMLVLSIVIGVLADRLALLLKNLGTLAGNKFTAKIKEKLDADDHIIASKN